MNSLSEYVSRLNEYSQKKGLKPPVYEDLGSSGPDHMKIFTQRVHFNGEVLADGVGNKKKLAKHNAAKQAYEILMGRQQEPAAASTSAEPAGQGVHHASGQTEDVDELCEKYSELNVNNQDSTLTNQIDFVSMVNIYCQKTKRLNKYIEVTPEAQSQKPFACRMEIGQQLYPVGTGLNKREARQRAAQLAWSALQKQVDWDSKVSVGSAMSQDDESETTATSTIASNLLEPDFSDQSAQPSSGSSSIQFKESKSSPAQERSSTQSNGDEKNTENAVPEKPFRFTSDYDHIKPLGSGSYGQVYKARRKILNSYWAIKEILTKDLQKSLQEVKILSDLLHPNIVRYYTCWVEDRGYSRRNSNVLFIEMEFCDGGTLREWIQKKKREPLDNSRQKEGLEFAGQILNGVEYIHSKKLIHRDLKPGNIFLGHDGKVRIGDFGLATQDNDEGEVVERTEDRGTRSYMAPEQFGVNYDRKVDIFALGLIFFELFWKICTGHEREVIWKDVRCQKLPKEFTQTYQIESHIIKDMLSNKPEDRPEASTLKSELGKWTRTPEKDNDQKTV